MNGLRRLFAITLIMSSGALAAAAQDARSTDDPQATAEGVVTTLYDLVTFEAGETPDWARVRSLFLDEAVIVLRTSRDSLSVFSPDGFVADFVRFVENYSIADRGFEERILRLHPVVVGDVAHVLVLYAAHIPGSERAPQQGVDSFQLVRRSGRWWIASVANEIPGPEKPVPDVLTQ